MSNIVYYDSTIHISTQNGKFPMSQAWKDDPLQTFNKVLPANIHYNENTIIQSGKLMSPAISRGLIRMVRQNLEIWRKQKTGILNRKSEIKLSHHTTIGGRKFMDGYK